MRVPSPHREVVHAHGGSVVEFHGDGVLAVFGAPGRGDRDWIGDLRRLGYTADTPRSTTRVWPVTKRDASLAKKTAAALSWPTSRGGAAALRELVSRLPG